MKRNIFQKKQMKDSSGEVVIEAMILVIIIIYAIFFTINVACIYYNRMTMAAVAQEAASGPGAVYSSEAREPFVGYVSTGYFEGRDVYRYFQFNKSMDTQTEYKAKWYGSYLLYKNEFATSHNEGLSPHVETVCEANNKLGATVIKVTIEKEYPVFIANPMKFFGLNPQYTCHATGSAVCYDPIHQINLMSLCDEFATGVNGMLSVTETMDGLEVKGGKAAGSTMDFGGKVLDLLNKIVGIFQK